MMFKQVNETKMFKTLLKYFYSICEAKKKKLV